MLAAMRRGFSDPHPPDEDLLFGPPADLTGDGRAQDFLIKIVAGPTGTSTVTASGTTTLTSSSTATQIFTGAQTQTIALPNATTLAVGTTYTIYNYSSGVLTVEDDASNTLATIPSGGVFTFTVQSIGTPAGVWVHSRVATVTGAYYAWIEVFKVGNQVITGLRSGTLLTIPAVELNGNVGVAPGTIWRAWPAAGGDHLDFNACCAEGTVIPTSGGTTTLSSNDLGVQQIFTGSSNQNVVLPDATTIPAGSSFQIFNYSTGVLTIKDNGGNTIASVPPGSYILVSVTSVATANGVWVFALSGVMPGQLPAQSTVTAGGTTTLTASLPTTQIFTGSSNQTLVLPDATTIPVGSTYNILNSSTGLITVNLNGGSNLTTVAPSSYYSATLATNPSAPGTWNATGSGTTGTTVSATSWVKASQDYTAFQTAGATKTITLYAMPPGGVLQTVRYQVTTTFSGGGSTYTGTIGYSGGSGTPSDAGHYATAITLGSTNTNPIISTTNQPDTENQSSSWNVTMTVNCTGGTPSLNNLTQGHIDIWLLVSSAA